MDYGESPAETTRRLAEEVNQALDKLIAVVNEAFDASR